MMMKKEEGGPGGDDDWNTSRVAGIKTQKRSRGGEKNFLQREELKFRGIRGKE